MANPTAYSPLGIIQTAFYQRLSDVLSVPVYDYVPEGAAYPYVRVGEASQTPDNTLKGYGRETVHTVHVWTKFRGFSQASTIENEVISALDNHCLVLPEPWHHVSTVYELSQTLYDPDPELRHVPIQFRVRTQQKG